MGFEEDFDEIHQRMEKIIRGFFPERCFQIPGESWSPPMDIYETETDLVIVVELAGAVPESLTIAFDGGSLKISGRRESLASCSHTKCHQIEIDSGPFRKQIYIPFSVDQNKATSQYKDGLLKITFPKTTRPPDRKIEISSK